MSPPKLTRNTPIFNVFHPVIVNFRKPCRRKFDTFSSYGSNRGLRKGFHFYEPLFRNSRFDRIVATITMPYVVSVRFDLFHIAESLQIFYNLFSALVTSHAGIFARFIVHLTVVAYDSYNLKVMS